MSRDEIEQLDSIWKAPGFLPTMIAVAAAFGAWALLLPVLPVAVLDYGGSATLAGLTTGIFMLATVITQVFTPAMLRSIGYRPVMVTSALLLGVPALGHIISMEPWAVLLFCAMRGVGFGAITVAESALVAELIPARFLGKGTGLLGVFVGVAQMLFLPVGLAIAPQFGYNTVYVVGAVIALIAGVMALRIPSLKADPVEPRSTDTSQVHTPMWKLVAVPALALTTLSMSYGVITSFLPSAMREMDTEAGVVLGGIILSVVGAASMIVRYGVGIIADKRGEPGITMIPAQLAGFLGMVIIVVVMLTGASVWWLVLAAILYGGAFGAVQNESLLSMFHRLPRSQVSNASAAWNIFFDGGTGFGSTVLGMVVAASGYPGAFAAGAAIIALGIVMTTIDRMLGKHRVVPHNNIATRLKTVRRRK
ncbi:permease of the major facilitator superfamily [Corynebacterium pilosum]|uniref:Permease of the major facilitator superfamily n=2 Tax=Corynebacterium pilosum TaxID=35756 RepID=A0A376CIG2_9CORY|nr:MFS transporter [Corynebacterium pilosum]STC68261.1 permease of the major facilitator superfamily [Corynebacterium pilosum]